MDNETTKFEPLPSTREQRGREIARRGGICQLGESYVVPSQSANSNAPTYSVDLVNERCTCPDHQTRGGRCKHIEATYFWLAAGAAVDGGTVNDDDSRDEKGEAEDTARSELPVAPKRKTYRQSAGYTQAQTTERERVPLLLKALCEGLVEPERPVSKPGPKPIPLREAIFAAVMKVASLCSGRRAESDIRRFAEQSLLSRTWDHNTICRVMESPLTTPVLVQLIEESAAPLATIEGVRGQYAADSTGLSMVTYIRWYDVKHGQVRSRHPFTKLHFICGTLTHGIVGVKISDEADCPVLPELIAAASKRHVMKEISADKAYLADYNLDAIVEAGATPFIPFKANSQGMTHPSAHWRKMWAHFALKSEDAWDRYHRRSNAETVVSMLKRKFGGSLRSKLPSARTNETLCKVLLHNLARIVHMIEEFGIVVDFAPKAGEPNP